jgi:flagellar biosynthesis protein FlhG
MRTISITGGKGGVGKTSIASGLGIALSQAGHRTVLFDADLALANLDVVLGFRSEFNLQHVINEERTLKEILHDGPGGVKVVTGASGVAGLASAGPKKLMKFFSQVFAIEADTDYLIFDTGSGIDRRIMSFLKASDDIIVVITPDAASLTDGYATIKTAFRGNKGARIHVIVNMVDSDVEAYKTFSTLSTIVKQFLKAEIEFLGAVFSDPIAAKCIRTRKPFMIAAPNCAASKNLLAVSEKVVSWTPNEERSFSDRISAIYDVA